MMDHEEAMKLHAAERYLLNELSGEERDDFEQHYFVCPECADEVRSAFRLVDNAKAVFREDAAARRPVPFESGRAPARRSWLRYGTSAIAAPIAAVLLLGVTLYQSAFVIPQLRKDLEQATAPRVLPSVVARAATRGEDPFVEVSQQDQFLQLILDINPSIPVSSYTCEIYDESPQMRFAVPASVPATGGSLNLLLPVAGLKSGRYTIQVKPQKGGGSSSEPRPEEFSFVLKRK